jgi:hypothetical protein
MLYPAPLVERHGWPTSPRVAKIALQGRAGICKQMRSSNSGLMLLALLVGPGAGGGAIVIRWLIGTFTLLLSAHVDYHWPVDRRSRGRSCRRSLRSLVVATARPSVSMGVEAPHTDGAGTSGLYILAADRR